MASNIVEIKLSEIDKVQEVLSKQNQEIERLHSIIKEVREYIDSHYLLPNDKGLLEILDKENKGE